MGVDMLEDEQADLATTDPDETPPNDETREASFEPPRAVDSLSITSDDGLTFDEALRLSGRRGARVVMLMGETGTGKTTVIVELWTHLVGFDAIEGFRCAGSRTAMPLERRAFLSRMAAGRTIADTERTHFEQDEGLLHLRVARPDTQRVELLFGDYAGERFRRIREGAPLLEEVPWAPRADRVAVLLDGSVLGTGGQRELALNRSTRQIHALRLANTFHQSASLAIVLTKNDLVTESALSESAERIEALLEEARTIDVGTSLIRLAARPADGSIASGLGDLLRWLCDDVPIEGPAAVPMPTPARAVARLRIQ